MGVILFTHTLSEVAMPRKLANLVEGIGRCTQQAGVDTILSVHVECIGLARLSTTPENFSNGKASAANFSHGSPTIVYIESDNNSRTAKNASLRRLGLFLRAPFLPRL